MEQYFYMNFFRTLLMPLGTNPWLEDLLTNSTDSRNCGARKSLILCYFIAQIITQEQQRLLFLLAAALRMSYTYVLYPTCLYKGLQLI